MVIFLKLIVALVIVLIAGFVVTQLVIPTITGEPFFPMFRKSAARQKIKETEKQLQSISEEEQLHTLTDEVQRRKAQLEETK